MDVKEEGLITGDIEAHWYYRAKLTALRTIIRDLKPSCALDVGGGLGFFSRALLKETDLTAATCVDPGYSADRDETVFGKRLSFRRHSDRSEADLVLMMDVIEHVPKSHQALTARHIEPRLRQALGRGSDGSETPVC